MAHNLATNLGVLRRSAEMSQQQFVNALFHEQNFDITRSSYASYEEGRCEPNITTLMALARFYGITIDELIE